VILLGFETDTQKMTHVEQTVQGLLCCGAARSATTQTWRDFGDTIHVLAVTCAVKLLYERACNGMRAYMSQALSDEEREQLEQELRVVQQEHGDLDAAIDALLRSSLPDQLQIQRLKKRKLLLKDRLTSVSGRLLPDIIA
jgi:hypothetical protein